MPELGVFTRGRQYVRKTLAERFWAHVNRTATGCWLWRGACINTGYGCLRHEGRTLTAHTVAWLLATGEEPPEGLFVCHTCDVRRCVNPAHLFLGTPRDNIVDAVRKGRLVQQARPERMPRGSRHHQSKLNEEQVEEIRRLHARGLSQRALGRRYGVSGTMVGYIVNRRFWRHVS